MGKQSCILITPTLPESGVLIRGPSIGRVMELRFDAAQMLR
jgi:hypothetical protein